MSDPKHAGVCYFCGESNQNALEIHHLVPQRFGGSDEAENTVLLCGACHDKIERLYNDQFYERLDAAVDDVSFSGPDYASGHSIQAEQSLDRLIPPRSEHIRVERIGGLDEPSRNYHSQATRQINMNRNGNTPIEENASEISEQERGTQPIGDRYKIVDYPDHYRLHCSYCHTVFSQNQHSDMARHLRIRHGIDDPYEVRDSQFSTVHDTDLLGDLYE